MKRTLMLIAIATLTVFGQKIETQTLDRNRVTRLGTAQDHLSVIELGEPEDCAEGPATRDSVRRLGTRRNDHGSVACKRAPRPATLRKFWGCLTSSVVQLGRG